MNETPSPHRFKVTNVETRTGYGTRVRIDIEDRGWTSQRANLADVPPDALAALRLWLGEPSC